MALIERLPHVEGVIVEREERGAGVVGLEGGSMLAQPTDAPCDGPPPATRTLDLCATLGPRVDRTVALAPDDDPVRALLLIHVEPLAVVAADALAS